MSTSRRTFLRVAVITIMIVAAIWTGVRALVARSDKYKTSGGADWVTYRNDAYGFSLSYPPSAFYPVTSDYSTSTGLLLFPNESSDGIHTKKLTLSVTRVSTETLSDDPLYIQATVDGHTVYKGSGTYELLESRTTACTESKDILFKLKGSFCLLYTSPSPRDRQKSRMPSSA